MGLGVPIVGRMDDSKIIDALGGTTEVARLCKVRPPSVSGWRVNGIPAARRQYLELLRPDVFNAARVEDQGDGVASSLADCECADGDEREGQGRVVHATDAALQARPAA